MKKNKQSIWWILIIVVALLDITLNLVGIIPGFGDIADLIINTVAEITELGLIFGLLKSKK